MLFSSKIVSLSLSLLLGVGGVGVANAALSPDTQQKIANWVQNDPNPMPMNTTQNTAKVSNQSTPKQTVNLTATTDSVNLVTGTTSQSANVNTPQQTTNVVQPTAEQIKAMHDNWVKLVQNGTFQNKSDLYQQMTEMDRQMMKNITPEQMIELDKAWMEQMNKQRTVNQTKNPANAQKNTTNKPVQQANTHHTSTKPTQNQTVKQNTNMNMNQINQQPMHDSQMGKNHQQIEPNHQRNMSENHQNWNNDHSSRW
ncbi:hypothetical protein [Tepidibacillus fermentans]|uniref:Uncharacterized protein n=1 Tax=Tepidibacillus fermentans TaxID=1281767 RepID=A0A4R3KAF5_9BACI|nr:hypothetical protein [Tepidibacillus fermentans]TCS79889.1 hypothetical protein EDD72_1197 [Tepidibacillus fermentans]